MREQRISFETKAVMDYLDFKKFDEIQNQALNRRLYGQILPLDKELVAHDLKHLRSAVTILRDLAQDTARSVLLGLPHLRPGRAVLTAGH